MMGALRHYFYIIFAIVNFYAVFVVYVCFTVERVNVKPSNSRQAVNRKVLCSVVYLMFYHFVSTRVLKNMTRARVC